MAAAANYCDQPPLGELFGNVDRGQQGPLLLAGEGDEPGTMLAWSVLAVRAANSGEAF